MPGPQPAGSELAFGAACMISSSDLRTASMRVFSAGGRRFSCATASTLTSIITSQPCPFASSIRAMRHGM